MSVCTYDNPATMSRECWQNGNLLCSYTAALLERSDTHIKPLLFFGANIGRWKTGQLVGEWKAMRNRPGGWR